MTNQTTVINPSTDCRVCHAPNCDHTLVTEWDDSNSGKRWQFLSPVCGADYCVAKLENALADRIHDMHGDVSITFSIGSGNDDPF